MRFTYIDILPILAKVRQVHRAPDGMDPEKLARVWLGVLDGTTPAEITAAVEAYLASDARYWPKPGQLRRWILEDRVRRGVSNLTGRALTYAEWEHEGMPRGDPCPVCGSVLEWGERSRRMHVWHDARQHAEAGVRFAGPRQRRSDACAKVASFVLCS